MAGVVHIPWYATGFRADKLEAALAGIAPVALRYGARSYQVHRFRDDRYKFLQTAEFESKLDFERYWNGPEFIDFRVLCSSWYQVPVTLRLDRSRRRRHARARGGRARLARPRGRRAHRRPRGLTRVAARRSATCARASARCPSACAPATGG